MGLSRKASSAEKPKPPSRKKVLKARGCERKKRFDSESDAQAAAEDWNKTNGALEGHVLEAYHCRYHAHWHIGHSK